MMKKKSKAINNLKHLVDNMKSYYFFEMNDVLFYLFGYKDVSNKIKINIQTQLNILSILDKVMTASNSNRFQRFLFYVYNGNIGFSESVRIKAMQLLRDRNKFDWKPPAS